MREARRFQNFKHTLPTSHEVNVSVFLFKSCIPEDHVMSCSVREKRLYPSLERCMLKRLITGRAACSRELCQKWEDRLSIREQVLGVECWWKMEKLNIPTERTGISSELVRSSCSGQCTCVWCWSQDWFWTDPHCVCSPLGSSKPRPAGSGSSFRIAGSFHLQYVLPWNV